MKIDWKLFPIKLHYFVRFAGTGPLTPFLPVIARHKGVSAYLISLIWTVMPFLSLVSKTCAGAIADYWRVHRAVFLLGLMVMLGSFIGVYFTPDITFDVANIINNNNSSSSIDIVANHNENISSIIDTKVLNNINESELLRPPGNSSRITQEISTWDIMSRYEFWLLFLCLVGQFCGHITTITMQETICFSLLGDALHKYGQQRLWGTFGWGLAAVAGGALVDWYSKGLVPPDYAPAFLMAVVFLTLDLLIVAKMKFSISTKKLDPKAVRGLFKIPEVLLVLITIVIAGASCGMLWTFQLIFVEDIALMWQPDFPYTKLLQGLLVFVQCILSEMPFFFMAGYITSKIGHFYSFFIALLAFCVRLSLYSAVTNPWWFLPIELTHGVSFGLAYATMASYANSITPKGAEATTQAIFGAAFFGGTGVGGLVGGYLLSVMPAWKAFLTAGIINGIYAFIFLAIYFLMKYLGGTTKSKQEKKGDPEEAAAAEEMEKFQVGDTST